MGMALQRNRITSDLASKGMSLYTAQSATGIRLWPSADGGLQIALRTGPLPHTTAWSGVADVGRG